MEALALTNLYITLNFGTYLMNVMKYGRISSLSLSTIPARYATLRKDCITKCNLSRAHLRPRAYIWIDSARRGSCPILLFLRNEIRHRRFFRTVFELICSESDPCTGSIAIVRSSAPDLTISVLQCGNVLRRLKNIETTTRANPRTLSYTIARPVGKGNPSSIVSNCRSMNHKRLSKAVISAFVLTPAAVKAPSSIANELLVGFQLSLCLICAGAHAIEEAVPFSCRTKVIRHSCFKTTQLSISSQERRHSNGNNPSRQREHEHISLTFQAALF